MRIMQGAFLAAALLAQQVSAHAVGAALGIGKGQSNLVSHKITLQWDLGPWWQKDKRYHLHGYWDAGLASWHASRGIFKGSRDDASMFSAGPQIRWQRSRPDEHGNIPYIEVGVGGSWLSKEEIGGRRMSHLQFEDRFGLGILVGKDQSWDVTYRLFHYSNGSLGTNNSGMNIQLFSVGRWF